MVVLVIWGGEVSQGVAERIVSEGAAQPQPVAMRAVSMADYKRKELQALAEAQSTAVLLLQTVENNEPPESAGGFLRFFKRKTHPEGMLAGKLAFTVLALGDSNLLLDRQTTTAADCTKCGQDLDSRLGQLGAPRFYARGEADERTGMQEMEPWIGGLWPALLTASGNGDGAAGSELEPEAE